MLLTYNRSINYKILTFVVLSCQTHYRVDCVQPEDSICNQLIIELLQMSSSCWFMLLCSCLFLYLFKKFQSLKENKYWDTQKHSCKDFYFYFCHHNNC